MISKDEFQTIESTTYEFGKFRLEAENLLLFKDSEIVPLAPKAGEVLLALVETRGKLLTKQELLDRVWADTFVEESNLAQHVSALRKTLGENGNGAKYIETIPRKGYRFVADVKIPQSRETEITFGERTKTSLVEKISIETSEAPPLAAPRRKISFRLAIAAFGVAALFAAFAAYKYQASNADFRVGKLSRLTSTGKTMLATVSPDGKFVAHVQESIEGESLWLRQTSGDGNAQIVAPAKIKFRGLAFSPDGNQVYYTIDADAQDSDLYAVSALGGAPRKILAGVLSDKPSGITFAPDGKRFAFFRKADDKYLLMTASADGAAEEIFKALDIDGEFSGSPAWSPDGTTILCPYWRNDGYYNIWAVNVADRTARFVIADKFTNFNQIAWLPDSKHFLMLAFDQTETSLFQFWRVSFPDGQLQSLNSDFYNYESFGVSKDGRILAAVRLEKPAQIWTMPSDADAGSLKQLTNGFEQLYGVWGLNWTANDRIVFEAAPSGRDAIMTMNADGANQRTLVSSPGVGLGAASPDGRFYAYQKTISGTKTTGLFLFDENDNSERRLTTGTEAWAAFAPDSRTIVFSRYEADDSIDLWTVSVAGGEAVRITQNLNAICADISRDGKFIAAITRKADERKLVILPIAGGAPLKSFPADYIPGGNLNRRRIQWTPDGRAVNFVRTTNGVSNIWRQSLSGGAPLQQTNFTTDLIFNFAYSPDGSQLTLSHGRFDRDVTIIENAN